MPSPEIHRCLLCSGTELRVLPGYEKDHLVACKSCAFTFSARHPTSEELDKVYGSYQRDFVRTEMTLQKMRETARRLKDASQARRVIDVGCGDGEFLRCFGELGCEVFGSEYGAEAEEVCRRKGITMLVGGVMPSMPVGYPEAGFDLAIFTEVIEHVQNPREVLGNLWQLLRPGGLLYVTTPNFASLERRMIGPQWGMIAYPEHLSYYSPDTLDYALRMAGFERISLSSENVSLFRIVQYLNRRKSTAQGGGRLDAESMSAVAQKAVQGNVVLRLVKRMINACLRWTGSGTSLVALYRRA